MSSYWTSQASDKAQSSQTIRILIKTLQYLAEDVAITPETSNKFSKVASQVIKSTFTPSSKFNMNEQVTTFLGQLGWKNSQIRLKSAEVLEIVLGSNRYLDQGESNREGLNLLVKALGTAVGAHILSRDVDTFVDIDLPNKSYKVTIQGISGFKTEKAEVKTKAQSISAEIAKKEAKRVNETKTTTVTTSFISTYDTSQIILPVINNRLPYLKLQSLLKDVIEEFSKSWYQEVPELTAANDEGNIAILLSYLISKADERGNDIVQLGNQVGTYFGDAIKATFPGEETVSQEIIEGSSGGSIIRDIKARSLCTLVNTQSCGSSIGGEARKFCDMSMGIWAGVLGKLTEKDYTFSGFYEAGKKDPYCLMEFTVK